MLILKDILIPVIIAIGIGKISELQSPKYYDIITDDGKVVNIMVNKNMKHACPAHCAISHYHKTLLLENRIEYNNLFYILSGFKDEEISINSYKVVEMNEVRLSKKPQKIENISVQTYLP